MKQSVYLVIGRHGVDRMTKRTPELSRGEVVVKLELDISQDALKPPMLTRKVEITDWREGTFIDDVELLQGFITEEEAEIIRQRRIAQMSEVLRERGYTVAPPAAEGGDSDDPADR